MITTIYTEDSGHYKMFSNKTVVKVMTKLVIILCYDCNNDQSDDVTHLVQFFSLRLQPANVHLHLSVLLL